MVKDEGGNIQKRKSENGSRKLKKNILTQSHGGGEVRSVECGVRNGEEIGNRSVEENNLTRSRGEIQIGNDKSEIGNGRRSRKR